MEEFEEEAERYKVQFNQAQHENASLREQIA
jgi:hypothetical protein